MKITVKRDKRFRLTPEQLRQANANTLTRIADRMTEMADQTHQTWETPVGKSINRTQRSVTLIVDSEIWHFVDGGTAPHVISPGPRGFLAFQGGYSAKTTPGNIVSGSGGPSGDWVFTRKPVQHPGTTARKFGKKIAETVGDEKLQIWREELAKVR